MVEAYLAQLRLQAAAAAASYTDTLANGTTASRCATTAAS